MANQTVSVNKNFNDASMSSLANSETITIDSGATLTINSDNHRSHNAVVFDSLTISTLTVIKVI
jgi:hypothetical protein